ncbi:Bdr family repetitive protein [Borrelia coriaceae]|uniref:BDR-repeat family protein n=1 Tax=Borrelia coriaceae ATCC 43381 TaxID=1408429 RepID=W5SWJ9_9SPIR|nr:Bdr family repetitive protein [Borrelia coriaceae]AHH11574.1 BDR-repeat family protein [Borrelia coriaceae ATCC 43381]
MQESSLHAVSSPQVFNGYVTEDMIYQEFVKMGMQDYVANDLSKRYYRNELTYKDIEYLDSNFNLKLEMLERSLKSEIVSVRIELDNKIDNVESNLNVKIGNVRSELKSDIKDLDNKIDTKFSELDNKIDLNKMELDNKIDKTASEFRSTLRVHNWMLGTIITICLGILLTLIFK